MNTPIQCEKTMATRKGDWSSSEDGDDEFFAKTRLYIRSPEKRSKCDKVVVLENAFDPARIKDDYSRYSIYCKKLQEKCENYGEVDQFILYDEHPQGVCQVFYDTIEDADYAISCLNGMILSNGQIIAKTWDGITNYNKNETEEKRKERLAQWDIILGVNADDSWRDLLTPVKKKSKPAKTPPLPNSPCEYDLLVKKHREAFEAKKAEMGLQKTTKQVKEAEKIAKAARKENEQAQKKAKKDIPEGKTPKPRAAKKTPAASKVETPQQTKKNEFNVQTGRLLRFRF